MRRYTALQSSFVKNPSNKLLTLSALFCLSLSRRIRHFLSDICIACSYVSWMYANLCISNVKYAKNVCIFRAVPAQRSSLIYYCLELMHHLHILGRIKFVLMFKIQNKKVIIIITFLYCTAHIMPRHNHNRLTSSSTTPPKKNNFLIFILTAARLF